MTERKGDVEMWHRGLVLIAVLAALIPGGARAAEPPVSVTLQDADIRQVVAQLLRDAGINYVFADEVPGKVTATLKDVPLRQALRLLLDAAGCEATEVEDVLVIRRRAQTPPPAPAGAAANASGEGVATESSPASGNEKPGQTTGSEGAPAVLPAVGLAGLAPADSQTVADEGGYVLMPPEEGMQEVGLPVRQEPRPLVLPFYTPVNPNLMRALAWIGGSGPWRLSPMGRGLEVGGSPRGLWDYFGR